jgi:Transposase DNA-binding/Transposase Tn5 dimerisation domain
MRSAWREAHSWAEEEFGAVDLGHDAREKRLVRMATEAALRPAGKVSDVFTTSATAEAAYRWLENPSIRSEQLVEGIGRACAERAGEFPFVFVPVDGSSLTLVDGERAKDFGPIGTTKAGARGVKVLGAIAVSPQGVPLGVAALEYWTRKVSPRKKKSNASRATKDKETQRWLDAVTHTCERFAEVSPLTRCWFQLDREADSWPLLHHLDATGHWFTVRSSTNRRLASSTHGNPRYLRKKLKRAPIRATFELDLAPGHGRQKRRAKLTLRAMTVMLELRDPWMKTPHPMSVQAVWVRERGTTPNGEKPLDWMLYTNHAVDSAEDAALVVRGYCQRWRIEDFHKTWKSGACNVESSQLRAAEHVKKWATLLAAVAIRIERLKLLSRSQPELEASVELTRHEIRALVLWRRKSKKRTEEMPKPMPTIGEAVVWIAQMGGYTGKSSGGPPGSITIARGFERLRHRAAALEDLETEGDS